MEDDDMDASLDGPMSKRAVSRMSQPPRAAPSEKKIDRIEDRLAGIENVLASLATKLSSLDLQKDSHESSSQSRSSRVGPSRSPGSVLVEAPTPAPFEGESSINSQSDYAREMLARAIGSTPSIGQNEEVKLALTALSEMVSQHGQNPATSNPLINQSLVDIDPSKLERPPWEIACYALEKASEYPTMAFAVVFPFLRMANLKEIFYDVYHNPETCSAARRVLTFGVLENVFNEFRTLPLVNMDTTNYQSYAIISRRQTEVALSQLAIFLPASYENIMALVLGAAQAVEMCKPSLCWIMISSAAGLCQSLGYTKIHIFWMIYMLDKTLSLRLGRSSILQDWDISLPFVVSSDPNDKHAESSAFLSYWIKVARVQGLTYEKLFCPAAFTRSTEERTRIAIELVNSLNQAWYERGDASIVDFSQQGQTYHLGTPRSNKIGNSPNETPLPSQYKRYVHKSQGKQGSEVNEYVQGTVHTADTSDVEPDLNSLSEFVGSLESCRTISEGADKLYKMCHLFLRVARLYVTAKKQDAASRSRGVMQNNQSGYYTTVDGTQLDLNAMSQFDPYLSALGLMPDTAWPTTYPNASTAATTTAFEQGEAMNNMDAVGSSGFGFGASQGNSNPMQDWFSGSRYLMNLMEPGDDLQMPDLDL
ncbi:uncharacterized protein J4E78_008400 [Alternaria triticimaculans]|uniref:uncharacterized protein n=1 Tax=Alternaria triticimaculans TaxID=297637 RepID=UPI0020C21DD7|nr:uncharacterized protein J4E78_008400 [Alternaria triticimaculans]KAI4650118.1 hypothetical protein J4E78_008400 [Alternaria triticimaculans]